MPESPQPSASNEDRLDRLFGTMEEIEAENAKRTAIYPPFRHEQTEPNVRNGHTAQSARERIAAAMIRRVSNLNERYESD